MDTEPTYERCDDRANSTENELRQRAVERLKAQREFRLHVAIYLAVNTFLVAIWWVTGAGFFWPVFPIFAWGIGVVANAWDAYGRAEATEDEIRREMNRLRR